MKKCNKNVEKKVSSILYFSFNKIQIDDIYFVDQLVILNR